MFELLSNIDWLEVIQSAASVFTAGVALVALNTWKAQSKAQRKSDFLDQLTDSIHEFIQELSTPIAVFKLIEISKDCYLPMPNDSYKDNPQENLIAYILEKGKSDSEKLFGKLSACNKSISEISSLVAKRQIYQFDNYAECQESCRMLLWQHERLQAAAALIDNSSLNWDNPEVQKSLKEIHSTSSKDIQKHISEWHVKYLEFAKSNYESIF